MMSVYLVAPPVIISRQHNGVHFAEPVEHLGLESVAGACSEAGIDVTCLDCRMSGLSAHEAAAQILQELPGIIGISIRCEQTDLDGATAIVSCLRNAGYQGLLAAGGLAATYMDSYLLHIGFDAVIRGEGELAFPRLAQDYMFGKDWRATAGLSFRAENGVVRNKIYYVKDLNQLAKPARQLRTQSREFRQTKTFPIETSRGCWNPCTYCTVPDFHGLHWRPKSLVKALAEIGEFYHPGISVEFVDDNFLGPVILYKQRVAELREALAELQYEIRFSFSCRADAVTGKILKELKQLGLERLYIDLGSGSENMLQRLSQGTSVSENIKAIETVQKVGIPANYRLIMFDPFTTVAELWETLELIKRTGIYKGGIRPLNLLHCLLVYKGTKLYRSLGAQGLLKPLGKTVFVGEFQDWRVGIIQELVSHLKQVIPGMLAQFNQINCKYFLLLRAIKEKYHLADGQLKLIPQLHYDFILRLLQWHENLPALIISIYEAVIEIVDDQFAPDMKRGVKAAIAEQVYRYMDRYLEADQCYLTMDKIRQLLAEPEITLSLPNGDEVEFESPLAQAGF